MLYYNGELVDYSNPRNTGKLEEKLRVEMQDLHERFFGKNAPGYAMLRYPKGVRRKNVSGYYEPSLPYEISHRSMDGMWVYTKYKKKQKKDGQEDYVDKFTVIRDPYIIQAKDIEFLWFVMNHSSSLKAGRVHIEDNEAKAEKVNNEMAQDIDVRFMLFSKKSPVYGDREIIKQVATVFGIEHPERLGFEQQKNAIYQLVSEGEKNKNRFVNNEAFDKLVNGANARRISFIVRSAINDGTLKFSTKDYKWYMASGGELVEELFSVKLADVPHKEERLLEAVLSDGALKGAIFSALGREDYESDDEIRQYDRKVLMSMCSRYGVAFSNSDKKEEIVKKLCEHLKVEYHEPK